MYRHKPISLRRLNRHGVVTRAIFACQLAKVNAAALLFASNSDQKLSTSLQTECGPISERRSVCDTLLLPGTPMPDATQASAVRRFGAFEINLQAGELRKRGMRLRLSGQPFQVLAVLVEHAGNVVTREELQSKLWLSDTFVDFDHGLNNAIARIREVLDDSSETPRYVETDSAPRLPLRRACC